MAKPWVRLYRDAILKPKVGKLTLDELGFWSACLMLSDDDGVIPSNEDLAWQLRLETETVSILVAALVRNALLIRDVTISNENSNIFRLHDWDVHQRKSDHDNGGSERQKRWREKQKEQKSADVSPVQDRNALRNADVTLSDTDTDTDKNKIIVLEQVRVPLEVQTKDPSPTDPEAPGWPKKPDLEIALRYWNDVASEVGLPAARGLAGERAKHLSARLKEIGSLGEWFGAVNSLKTQPFLTGKNDRNWRANFDWFVKPVNFSKVLENTYERSRSNGRA